MKFKNELTKSQIHDSEKYIYAKGLGRKKPIVDQPTNERADQPTDILCASPVEQRLPLS